MIPVLASFALGLAAGPLLGAGCTDGAARAPDSGDTGLLQCPDWEFPTASWALLSEGTTLNEILGSGTAETNPEEITIEYVTNDGESYRVRYRLGGTYPRDW